MKLWTLSQQSLEASPGKTGESSGKRSQAFEYVLKYSGRFTTKEQYGNILKIQLMKYPFERCC
jgi:HAE1 family hydrophobic/amphiphilic exporter-1